MKKPDRMEGSEGGVIEGNKVSELLKPRYKVIADYPNSIYKVGEIIEQSGENFFNAGFFETYPHLFKRLEWWQERRIEDLPKYVKRKTDGRILEVESWQGKNIHDVPLFYVANVNVIQVLMYFEPATFTEYTNYKKIKG